ncbi:YkvA family protein [Clostridium sp. DL1XJH146]
MIIIKKWINDKKVKAKELKKNIYVLFLAYKNPKTPWYAKVFAAIIVSYALSPIDLIPDFIPVLGFLDDIILLPIGITIAIKLIPTEVIDECKVIQENEDNIKKKGLVAGGVIFLFWAIIIGLLVKNFI